MLVITSYYSKVLKNLKFSTIDLGAFLVVLLLKIAFSIYPTFDENALIMIAMLSMKRKKERPFNSCTMVLIHIERHIHFKVCKPYA